MRNSTHGIFSLVAVLAISVGVMQAQVRLTLERPSAVQVQQSTQSPCVIGDNSCSNPAGFDLTLVPGNDFDVLSPVYMVSQLTAVATGGAFAIGIDANTSGNNPDPMNLCGGEKIATEQLVLFQVIRDPLGNNGGDPGPEVIFEFDRTIDDVAGNGALCTPNNGTGRSDNRLLVVNLLALAPTEEIQFRASQTNGSDGDENYFVIAENLAPQTSSLTVVKEIVPDGGETFGLAIDGPDADDASDPNVGHNGFVQVSGVPGAYAFSESNGTGDLADFTTTLACVETGTVIAFPFNAGMNNESGDVTLADQDDVTCTFTNTFNTAGITLIKDVSPNNGDDFGLAIDGPAADDASDPNVGDGGSISVLSGAPGVYNLSESDGTGALADYTTTLNCTGGGSDFTYNEGDTNGSITLATDDSVTCTFTNTFNTAGITLIKDVSPNNGDDFGLAIDGPAADDASDPNVGDGGSISVLSGAPGVYNLSESDGTGALADYTTTLNCTGGSDFTYNEGDTNGSITLAIDDSVTCTFTNTFVEILPEPPGDGLITCDLGAVTPLVRAEGIAELLGDIIIVCHTIPAGAVVDPDGYIEVNVTASLNVSVTNNRDFNAGFQDDTTDAVLVINENNCGAPTDRGARMDALGVTDSGFEAGCTPPDSDFQDPQFGVLVTNNRLEWVHLHSSPASSLGYIS